MVGELAREFGYAIRSLLRQPGFAAVTVGTIALGIGANTAIFSVVHAVLLAPLPYEAPDRLVVVWSNLTNRDVPKFPVSPPDLRDLQEQATLFEGFAGVTTFEQSLTDGDGAPELIDVAGVTPNLLEVLGIRPLLGRGFVPADADPIARGTNPADIPPASVVLGHELWERRFGRDESVLGRTIDINGNASLVVGVMPPETGLHFGVGRLTQEIDAWTPPRIDVAAWPARRNVVWTLVGRLRTGVTVAQAQAEMDGFSTRFRADSDLRETAGFRLDVYPMLQELTADVRPVILALFGAVAFVLLIACANVSNLFLVRATTREREFAIRTALGGSRGRVIRQLLVESGVLALAGGALGLLLATGGIGLLVSLSPSDLPRLDHVGIDASVLGFTLAASLGSALLFGLVPAVQGSNPHLTDSLKDRGRSSSLVSQRRFRSGVVITEVALSMTLMIGAGLMLRSFVELQRVDPGFDPEGVLTFAVSLPGRRYSGPETRAFFADLDARLGALPGVTNVSAASSVPLQGADNLGRYGPLEALNDQSLYGQGAYRIIRPGYFETMRTGLVEGRSFSPAEFADGGPVAVVDEVLAAKFSPGESPVGKRMLIRISTLDPEEVEIIGVVRHQRGPSLARDGTEGIYVTDEHAGGSRSLTYALRTVVDAASLVPRVRQTLQALDPLLPLSDVRTMESRVAEAMTETRFAMVLIGGFGVIAALLAGIGLYGVLAHVVRQRVGEFGVRRALGAPSDAILGIVLRQALGLTGVGIVAGLVASLWATRLMRGLLVGVPPVDAATYAVVSVGFLAVALLASWAPVSRATSVDPAVALRED